MLLHSRNEGAKAPRRSMSLQSRDEGMWNVMTWRALLMRPYRHRDADGRHDPGRLDLQRARVVQVLLIPEARD